MTMRRVIALGVLFGALVAGLVVLWDVARAEESGYELDWATGDCTVYDDWHPDGYDLVNATVAGDFIVRYPRELEIHWRFYGPQDSMVTVVKRDIHCDQWGFFLAGASVQANNDPGAGELPLDHDYYFEADIYRRHIEGQLWHLGTVCDYDYCDSPDEEPHEEF